MTINVRNQVFETNSSSSHSITVAADDMLDLSFDKEGLRNRVITITPRANGYGSEQFRYVTPEGKMGYLLVMAAGGEIDIHHSVFDGKEIDILPHMIRRPDYADNFRALYDFVREECRCELRFVMDHKLASSIYVSAQSIDLASLVQDKAKLRRLLFSSKSWIDTRHGEDVFHFDRYLESDIGQIFASPHAYVSRSLPSHFELTFRGEMASYSDGIGDMVSGVLTPPSAWEEATNSFIFLRSQTADAHIVDLQIGRDEEPRVDLEPESDSPFADAFHNLVHYLYLRNASDQAQGYGFKLTVEPGIKAHVRGRRQMKDFWPHFVAETGVKIAVACDEATRVDVRRYFEDAIRAKA
ncbi:hypothetical protein [Rhizobium sp. MHM7A]|uniref:hypothetical protein n=1 Tax=Rhizobium sp. MHM7A TaxID=2583233 RepID=UPI0011063C1F|nr:hypothetical protein [Rhizobium sp. MHM7A]TLX16432.1 hypothetical protein FFR93_03605 [Rhizobium sp. MHM7A]